MSGVSANQGKGEKNSKSKYSAVKINDLFKVSAFFMVCFVYVHLNFVFGYL